MNAEFFYLIYMYSVIQSIPFFTNFVLAEKLLSPDRDTLIILLINISCDAHSDLMTNE